MNEIIIFSPSVFQSYGHEFDYVSGLIGGLSTKSDVGVHLIGFDGPFADRLPSGVTPHILKVETVANAKGATAIDQIKWGLSRISQSKKLIDLTIEVANKLESSAVLFETFEYYSLASRISRFKRPLRCIFHDTSFNMQQTSIPAAIYKSAMARSAASIVAHCEWTYVHGTAMKDNLARSLRLKSEYASRVKPIPYGAPAPANSVQIEQTKARRELGIDGNNSPLLLAFGTLRRDKAFPMLLTALSLAPDWRLLIAGPEGDMTFDELESISRRLSISDRVICRNRFVTRDEQPVYFGAADAIAGIYSPSIRHESGTCQLARTYLKPIVASGPPDLEEYVQGAGVGWRVPEHTPEALAKTLARVKQATLQENAAMRARISECAEERSWSCVCSEIFRGWC